MLDRRDRPFDIMVTTTVTQGCFQDVDAQVARDESEGDRSLEAWRCEHWRYFEPVLPALGNYPTPERLLVCERFRFVYLGLAASRQSLGQKY